MSRVSRYVRRATTGLPRHERLEVAAELRTHLLDRVRQLEAEGFSREEAEHLAVTAMGRPAGTNRALLGHVFTTALGWTVLTALVIGGGGWWVWTRVPLPLPGVREASWNWSKELSSDDLRDILGYEYAPRGQMLAGTLRVPPRTEWVYVAITPVGSGAGRGSGYWAMHRLAPAPGLGPNRVRRAQVVLGSSVWETGRCGGNGLALYEDMRWPAEQGRIRGSPQCLATLPPRTTVEWVQSSWGRTSWMVGQVRSDHHRAARPLPMNTWTPLALYGLDYRKLGSKQQSVIWRGDGQGMKAAYLYSVMPADHQMHQAVFPNEPASLSGRFDWGRHALGLPKPDLRLSR
ncbi:permease prefix domain 1-containing protein [Deinococcus sp. JMULE3]|uniref:permease prefix domain 1-containing protein n=1 Tax=Deinococcus sp. JMULE3 TaxID=2518341 RepID=UPI001575D08A